MSVQAGPCWDRTFIASYPAYPTSPPGQYQAEEKPGSRLKHIIAFIAC